MHPAFAGVTMMGCNLIGAASLAQALARISAYADAYPDRERVAGGGWRMEWFAGGAPGREILDRVVPDRPVYLLNRDAHGAWANSRALELAGIDARTPDPPDGRIEREAGGSPQGTLHEGAASLVGDKVPRPTFDERLAGLLLAQEHMHARGITAWQDAIVGDYLGAQDPLEVYGRRAAARHPQPARAWSGGPVPGQYRQDHARRRRRELHRGHARALSRRLRLPDNGPGPLPR